MEKGLSPAHGVSRPISPLKSPLLRRHFAPIETNIHYPIKLISTKPVYKHLLICEDGKFRGSVDVHDYRPEEIKVKTIGHTILIELKHDEKDDGFGVVTRSFSKKFILPLTMDMAKIRLLCIKAN